MEMVTKRWQVRIVLRTWKGRTASPEAPIITMPEHYDFAMDRNTRTESQHRQAPNFVLHTSEYPVVEVKETT